MNYADYLQTPHWQKVRVDALKRAKGRCSLCDSKVRLDVHHRTYARRGHENPEDVIVLCNRCHGRHHGTLAPAGGPSRELVALVQRQMAEAI